MRRIDRIGGDHFISFQNVSFPHATPLTSNHHPHPFLITIPPTGLNRTATASPPQLLVGGPLLSLVLVLLVVGSDVTGISSSVLI